MKTDFDFATVDRAVGAEVARIRRRRGLSQTALARQVGVTFQQIQKYESGSNRLAASRLLAITTALGVNIAAVFPMEEDRTHLSVFRASAYAAELLDVAEKLDPDQRQQLLVTARLLQDV